MVLLPLSPPLPLWEVGDVVVGLLVEIGAEGCGVEVGAEDCVVEVDDDDDGWVEVTGG